MLDAVVSEPAIIRRLLSLTSSSLLKRGALLSDRSAWRRFVKTSGG